MLETGDTEGEILAGILEMYPDESFIRLDGYDDAVHGVVERMGHDLVLLYDKGKILDILQERDGMEPDEAMEFFDFNIAGSYMGPKTPAFLGLSF